MQLVFTQAATLNPDGTKIQVGHEPDGELVQYFLNSDRVRNSSYKVVLGNYSAVSFSAIPNRIPSRNYVRFGIKTFPKIGAYGWFRSKYENITHMLVPLRNIPTKYTPPTFSFTQTTTVNIVIVPPSTVTYECYRIIFRDAYYSFEVITYDTTVSVEKPRNGTYELYIIGYRSTGETSEETPRQSIVITGGAADISDRVASLAAFGETALTGNVVLKAGTNVTLSENVTSKEITIAATGGGGSSTPSYANPIDEPPATPNAMDDEFSDTTLASKWSWLNQNNAVWTEFQGRGIMELPGGIGGDNIRALLQTAPSGAFTVTVKVRALMRLVNYMDVGLVVQDSATSRLFLMTIGRRSTNSYLHYYAMNSPTSWNSDPYLAEWDPNIQYLRFVFDGTNLAGQASIDGTCWTQVYTRALAGFFTSIGKVGIGTLRSNSEAVKMYGIFEWFRVTQP